MFMFVSGIFFPFPTQVQDVDGSRCGRYWSRGAQRFKLRSAQWSCSQVPRFGGYVRVMKNAHSQKHYRGQNLTRLSGLVFWWNLNSSCK